MRLGLQIPSFTWPGGAAEIAPRLGEIARAADEVGLASLWVMDHFFQIPSVGPAEREMLEGWSTLAFLAAQTRRIALGTLVTGVTYRHPGVLVKTATTLDVLSGGRAYLGIGAAWYEREHVGLGVRFRPRAGGFQRAGRPARESGNRRGLVRARARRAGRAVPAARRALRAARGDAAHRAPDVVGQRRAVQGPAAAAEGDAVLPAAARAPAPAGADRRHRRAQDAPARRALRRRVERVRRDRREGARAQARRAARALRCRGPRRRRDRVHDHRPARHGRALRPRARPALPAPGERRLQPRDREPARPGARHRRRARRPRDPARGGRLLSKGGMAPAIGPAVRWPAGGAPKASEGPVRLHASKDFANPRNRMPAVWREGAK